MNISKCIHPYCTADAKLNQVYCKKHDQSPKAKIADDILLQVIAAVEEIRTKELTSSEAHCVLMKALK